MASATGGRQLVGRRDDKDKDTVGEMEWMVARGSGDRLEQGTKLEKSGGGVHSFYKHHCVSRGQAQRRAFNNKRQIKSDDAITAFPTD